MLLTSSLRRPSPTSHASPRPCIPLARRTQRYPSRRRMRAPSSPCTRHCRSPPFPLWPSALHRPTQAPSRSLTSQRLQLPYLPTPSACVLSGGERLRPYTLPARYNAKMYRDSRERSSIFLSCRSLARTHGTWGWGPSRTGCTATTRVLTATAGRIRLGFESSRAGPRAQRQAGRSPTAVPCAARRVVWTRVVPARPQPAAVGRRAGGVERGDAQGREGGKGMGKGRGEEARDEGEIGRGKSGIRGGRETVSERRCGYPPGPTAASGARREPCAAIGRDKYVPGCPPGPEGPRRGGRVFCLGESIFMQRNESTCRVHGKIRQQQQEPQGNRQLLWVSRPWFALLGQHD